MTDDRWKIALDANYAIHGVEATIAASTVDDTVTVIDKTSGVALGSDAEVQTIKPGACVRVAELAEKGIDRTDLKDASISFNGTAWIIRASFPRPTPTGESKAELLLILEKA